MKLRRQADPRTLAAFLEGEVTASERAAIELELDNSAEIRRTLAQIRDLSDQLAAPAPALESIDLAARVRAAVRAPVALQPRKRTPVLVWALGLAACLAVALAAMNHPNAIHGAVAVNAPRGEPNAGEFQARSNGAPLSADRRWAGIQVYRVAERGVPEPLGAELSAKDGLLFSYTNLAPQPFDYLMIFAVDAKNEVRWFYPAHEAAGENPVSIPIAHGRANVPLAELVQRDFAAGPLALYALFTRQPFSVADVQTWVKEHGRPAAESPLPGGSLQRINTQVAR